MWPLSLAHLSRLLVFLPVTLLLVFFATSSPAQTDPFVQPQTWFLGPGGTAGVVGDPSGIQVDVDGDGLLDQMHPFPLLMGQKMDVNTINYRLSPSQDFLYCFGSAAGPDNDETLIFLYRIPPNEGESLQALVGGFALPNGRAFDGFFDPGPGLHQRVFFAVEAADPITLEQQILWVDLETGAHADTDNPFSRVVGDITIAPTGIAAFVQYDTSDGDNLSDYRTVQLCAGNVGVSYSASGFPLNDIGPGGVEARVVSGTSPPQAEFVLDDGTVLDSFALVDCLASAPSTGACCFPDGSCADGLTQSACENATNGGSWQGGGTSCTGVSCPQPPPPSLEIVISGPDTVAAQQPVTYTFDYDNSGAGDANNVNVFVALPPGVELVGTSDDPTINGGQIVWFLDTLPAGESGSVSLTLTADCGTTGFSFFPTSYVLSSAETVAFGPTRVDVTVETSGATLQTSASAVADTGEPVLNGETITWTIDLVNPGGSAWTDLRFSANYGPFNLLDAVLDDGGGTFDGQVGFFEWRGDVPGQSSVTVQWRTRIDECRLPSTDEAVLNSGFDITISDACGQVAGTITPPAPVSLGPVPLDVRVEVTNQRISEVVGEETGGLNQPFYLLEPGTSLDLRLVVENQYDAPIDGVTASAVLPPEILPDGDPPFSASPPPGTTWDAGLQEVSWSGSLGAGSTVVIELGATYPSDGPCSSSVSVDAGTADCGDLVEGGVSLFTLPATYAENHLVGVTVFDGLWRSLPDQDPDTELAFCKSPETYNGLAEGQAGDLWLAGTPTVRINTSSLTNTLYTFDWFDTRGVANVLDVAVDPNTGIVYVLGKGNDEGLRLRRLDPSAQTLSTVLDSTYTRPQRLVLDPDGHLAFSVDEGVVRLDPADPASHQLYVTPVDVGAPEGLGLDENGDYLLVDRYAGDTTPRPLWRMDRDTGATTAIVADLNAYGSLSPGPVPVVSSAVDDSARIFLAPAFGGVLRLDPSNPGDPPVRLPGNLVDHRDIAWVGGEPTSTAAPETPERPTRLAFHAAAPNPFNPRTVLRFELPRDGAVRLDLHDLRGRRVATLLDGFREAGEHRLVWNGRDDGGQEVASGVYLARLETPVGVRVRKLVLAR